MAQLSHFIETFSCCYQFCLHFIIRVKLFEQISRQKKKSKRGSEKKTKSTSWEILVVKFESLLPDLTSEFLFGIFTEKNYFWGLT